MGIATVQTNKIDDKPTITVSPSRSQISVLTGTPSDIDCPKSPRRTPLTHLTYWT